MPSWTDYLPLIVDTAANTVGTYLQGRSQSQYNQQLDQRAKMLDDLAREELKRRDYYASLLLPNLLRGSGWSRGQIARHIGQGQQQPQGLDFGPNQPVTGPGVGGSGPGVYRGPYPDGFDGNPTTLSERERRRRVGDEEL